MNPSVLDKKNDILQWLMSVENPEIIQRLSEFKKEAVASAVNEPQAEYAVKDDFEERWARGMTSEQAREATKKRLREWWGK